MKSCAGEKKHQKINHKEKTYKIYEFMSQKISPNDSMYIWGLGLIKDIYTHYSFNSDIRIFSI